MFTSVRSRLMGVVGLGLLAITAVLATVVVELNRLASEHDHVVGRLQAMDTAVRGEAIGERFSHIVGNAIIHHDLEKTRTRLDALAEDAKRLIKQLEAEADTPEQRAEIAQVNEHIGAIETVLEKRLLPLLEDSGPMEEAVRVASKDINEHIAGMGTVLETFVHAAENEARDIESQFAATKSETLTYVIIIGVIAAILSAVLTLRVTRTITRSLDDTNEITHRIASGDLSRELHVTGKDEFAQLMNSCATMQSNLRSIVSQLQQDAKQISCMSGEFSTSTGQIAQATDDQSEAASSMAASIEELSVSITHMSEQAGEVRASSSSSGEASRQGGVVVDQLLAGNKGTANSVDAAASRVAELGRLSNEVSTVVKVIHEVAEQTNLLALNAAIEAARAGEQGRGFAVVADEVRKLAERTGQSTQEITQTISEIQSVVDEVSTAMKAAVDQVRDGETLSQKVRHSIDEIAKRTTDVIHSVHEITHALTEQSTASADIARRVEQIASASEENSAAVRTTADGAHRLNEVSRRLEQVAGRFRLA
ncbi:methyl-accepting chemotaxis protein [Nitrogeniibacter aestuarii]|uniref:methyl-accepting chemotaxis protein n=1 Tax=Nitrogeniibacter aestuarii TaxID=2815343 RepID=UPI001E45619C|nr:methyl-accepting chemotaxis protein [Nitrogeniibacter aestuarii]